MEILTPVHWTQNYYTGVFKEVSEYEWKRYTGIKMITYIKHMENKVESYPTELLLKSGIDNLNIWKQPADDFCRIESDADFKIHKNGAIELIKFLKDKFEL